MSIIEKMQHKYALSEQGAKDMIKAIGACTLANFAQMMPVGLLYFLTCDLFNRELPKSHIMIYVIGTIVCLLAVAGTEYLQYNATFFSTYVESGVRRRSLAEKLRKIPLSFFGKKDLADLTNTIMADCAMIETASSHWLPELVGAFIATTLVVISLFFYESRRRENKAELIHLFQLVLQFLICIHGEAGRRDGDFASGFYLLF